MRKADMVGGAALLVLSLLMIFIVIPAETAAGEWSGLSPYFYPVLMSSGIAIFALALVAQAAMRPDHYEGQERPLGVLQFGMFGLASLIVLAGVLAIDFFGIWVGGPFLIAAMMLFMGERNPMILVSTAILPVVVVYLLVIYVLNSPLP